VGILCPHWQRRMVLFHHRRGLVLCVAPAPADACFAAIAENDAGRSTFNIRTVRAAFSHAYAVLASGLADPRNFVGYAGNGSGRGTFSLPRPSYRATLGRAAAAEHALPCHDPQGYCALVDHSH
jgi:hypothetical protein